MLNYNFQSKSFCVPLPLLVSLTVLMSLVVSPLGNAFSEEIPVNPVVENTSASSEDTTDVEEGPWAAVWGEPAGTSLYLGMWSYHFVDDDDEYETTHNLLGLVYKGYFLGTFANSRDDQAWGAGVQRDFYRTTWGVLSAEFGYRLGLMYGYEKMQIGDSGIFPLLQVYSDIRYKHVGMQFAWGGSAFTAGFFIRF